jgi:hypothetical protein
MHWALLTPKVPGAPPLSPSIQMPTSEEASLELGWKIYFFNVERAPPQPVSARPFPKFYSGLADETLSLSES